MREFNDIVSYIDRMMSYIGNRWLEGVWNNQIDIQRVLDLFADDASRDLYCREIVYCVFGNFLRGDLPSTLAGMMSQAQWKEYCRRAGGICPDLEAPAHDTWVATYCKAATFILGQYQYKDKVGVKPGDVCLDVGACLGDTSIWMLENGARQTWAFEVDRANIECMRKTFAKKEIYNKVNIVEKALADKSGALFFTPNKGNVGAGRVTPAKTNDPACYEVECVTIDDFCAANGIAPDFVKMDIEGAEPLAIAGARDTLARCRPRIAICIYHSWPQRWEIPLRLADILPDYDFYLKKSNPAFETVFLGAPREQQAWQFTV